MTLEILSIIGLTLLPFFELRASIPYGIFLTDIHWFSVALLGITANIVLIPLVYFFVNYVMHFFLKIRFIDKLYQRKVVSIQRKIHPYIEKYGVYGLIAFIGVPLPGSGVYAGILAAYLLGFRFKQAMISAIIGVLIAGIIVTLVSLSGDSVFHFLIKNI